MRDCPSAGQGTGEKDDLINKDTNAKCLVDLSSKTDLKKIVLKQEKQQDIVSDDVGEVQCVIDTPSSKSTREIRFSQKEQQEQELNRRRI